MSRFVINDNGTVLDTSTNLTWQRDVPSQTFTWEGAKHYAASLDFAGGGWRLPTLQELVSVVDYSKFAPAIDAVVFPSTPPEFFWSASPYAVSSYLAWYVDFGYGYTFNSLVDGSGRVRCVR